MGCVAKYPEGSSAGVTKRWVWFCVLNGIILPFRASRSAKLYRSIWLEQGSPLLVHSRSARTELLALFERMQQTGWKAGQPLPAIVQHEAPP